MPRFDDLGPRGARHRYLRRLGAYEPVRADLETLRRLHREHLLHVPFENLDIRMGKPLSLDVRDLYEKMVESRRGGLCYELNGLFAWLLRELGFEVSLLAARTVDARARLSPRFDHMAILVHLEGGWLADVGFGDSTRDPIALNSPGFTMGLSGGFRVVRRRRGVFALERLGSDGCLRTEYVFDTVSREMADFQERCAYHQTSQDSRFKRTWLCTMATGRGRATVSDLTFTETTGARRVERELADEAEWRLVLQHRFGIELEGPGTKTRGPLARSGNGPPSRPSIRRSSGPPRRSDRSQVEVQARGR